MNRPRLAIRTADGNRRALRPALRPAGVAAVAVVLAIIGFVQAWRERAVNYGDLALIELRTRDVLSSHPPFTGAFSRWQWAHPGPLYQQLMAVPYRLGSASSTALRAATVALSVGWVVVLWAVVRRSARSTASVPLGARSAIAIAVLGVVASRGGFLIGDVWNPSVAVLPLLVTMVAAARSLDGAPGAGWIMLLAGSFCVQAHLGYLPVVAAVIALVGSVRVAGLRNTRRRAPTTGETSVRAPQPARRRGRLVGGALLTGVWLMPVLDTIVHPPGNLVRILRYLVDGDSTEPRAGLQIGLRAVLRASSVSWPWRANDSTFLATFDVGLGVLPGALVVALVVARVTVARRSRSARWLDVGLAGWAGSLVAASSITGLRYTYLTYWFHAVVWFTWVALAVTAVAEATRPPARSTDDDGSPVRWMASTTMARIVAVVGLAVQAALVGVVVADARSTEVVPPGQAAIVVDAAARIEHLAPGDALSVEASGDGFAANDVTAGVFNLLDRRGRTVHWPGMDRLVGAHRSTAVGRRFIVADAARLERAPGEWHVVQCWSVQSGLPVTVGDDLLCLGTER